MNYIILIFLIIIIFWIIIIYKFSKNKKLSSEKINFFQKNCKKISQEFDKKHQIINFDKLYHKLLNEIWYRGNFWDILKLKPKEIDDLNKIWELHKLRNKFVHDFDLLEEVILSKKAKEYKNEFEKLLKKVS